MLDLFNIQTPQNANYQEFFGGGTVRDWVKPRGVSMVRFMLIGAGGGARGGTSGQGGAGGGSGAVTHWLGPAMFIPDILRVSIGAGGIGNSLGGQASEIGAGGNTTIIYQLKNGTGYTLLIAEGSGAIQTAGAASTGGPFASIGLYRSIAGQSGSNAGASTTASATTFLSGGAGGSSALGTAGPTVAVNYGYPTSVAATAGTSNPGQDGFFITQPVLLGRAGSGGATTESAGGNGGKGGIGCGGGGGGEDATTGAGNGGDGAAFIWSW
jgi:hypothetical protein